MENRIQILAIVGSVSLLIVILELVRRRHLQERYALLWLLSAFVLLGLSIWRGLLGELALHMGIAYPPNALFLIAFGFILVLLLHFTLAVSRLADQTKVLAQQMALLDERQQQAERATAAPRRRPVGSSARFVPGEAGGEADAMLEPTTHH
jgi:hypothetical protein